MIDVKLFERQFPAGQNQDDRQVDIFGRHLPAAGRQIRALQVAISITHFSIDILVYPSKFCMIVILNE